MHTPMYNELDKFTTQPVARKERRHLHFLSERFYQNYHNWCLNSFCDYLPRLCPRLHPRGICFFTDILSQLGFIPFKVYFRSLYLSIKRYTKINSNQFSSYGAKISQTDTSYFWIPNIIRA